VNQRMCPHETCEHYRVPTVLLGGCDCGTALVAYRDASEPTNEQGGSGGGGVSPQTPQQKTTPVREEPLALRGNGRSAGYLIDPQVCATCLQSTRGALHGGCKRDGRGRLLVVEETRR
jgi:hypothetical protein